MIKVQEDVVLVLADAASFADFDGHRARNHVAGGEILGRGRITLHEALAFRIYKIAALATRALGHETARAIDSGRVELDEFHVLQRQAGPQRHRAAVAGLRVGAGAGMIDPPVAAGGKDRGLGAKPVQCTVVKIERDHAAAGALVVHDQVDRKELDIEFRGVPQRLAVHGVQHGVPGAVGSGAGALRLAFAVVHRHAAERPLIDPAVLGAREWHAPMLEFVNRLRRLAHHVFDRILIAQPVRSLDGVVHVPAPIVRMHVAERCGNAALGCDRMRARRKHLGDTGRAQASLAAPDHGASSTG